MSAIIIPFPVPSFYVESVNLEDPHVVDTIPLEARTRERAQEEAQQIANEYGWFGWCVFDNNDRIVM